MKSKRDIIHAERTKLAEGVGADPGIEVGATQHAVGVLGPQVEVGDIVDPPAAAYGPETGDIVVHNAEQVEIIETLQRLKRDTDSVIAMAAALKDEDESLHMQAVSWEVARCAHAERWIDDTGALGWRVGITFTSPTARRFMAFVGDKLRAMGYEDAIVEPWGG